jgi:hypothetical protein
VTALGDSRKGEPLQVMKLVQRHLVPGERRLREADPRVDLDARVRLACRRVEVGASDDLPVARAEVA